MRALVTRERLLDCKVPERLTSTIMSPAFDWTVMAVRAAETFAGAVNTLLVYAGPSGTGKSCAAGIAIALTRRAGQSGEVILPAEKDTPNAYLYRDNPGQWVVDMPVDGVGSGARRGRWLNTSACSEHIFDDRWWDAVRSCGALVIDDVGLELDQKVKDRLLGLIVDRDNDDRRTVLTTNLAALDFRDRYCAGAGERLRTRIRRGMWINVVARPGNPPQRAEAQP